MTDDESDRLDHACVKLHDALSTIIRQDRAAMVSKWVTLVEVIDEHGEPALWSMTSEGLSAWDHIGMVELHSRTIASGCAHDDDD